MIIRKYSNEKSRSSFNKNPRETSQNRRGITLKTKTSDKKSNRDCDLNPFVIWHPYWTSENNSHTCKMTILKKGKHKR